MGAPRPSLVDSITQLDDEIAAVIRDKRFAGDAGPDHDEVDEVREYLLRVRSAALHLELFRLHKAVQEASARLSAGRFRSALDVSTFVLDLVGRINASLARERARREVIHEVAWRAIYRVAIANAEWAMGIIGGDPDLVRFLAAGCRADSEYVRSSCQMIRLLLAASPVRSTRGAGCHDLLRGKV